MRTGSGGGGGGRHARVLPERGSGEEEMNQLPADGGHRHLAEQAGLFAKAVLAILESGGDRVDGGERCRVVAARLLQRFLARLAQDDGTTDRVFLEEHAARASRTRRCVAAPLTGGDFPGPASRDVDENGGMDHLVHQADLEGFPRANVAAGEDHVERRLQPDGAGQALGAAGAGKEPELDLGHREHGLRMIGRDAPGAGQRRLQAATQAPTMDGCHHREAQPLEALEQGMADPARGLRVSRAAPLEKLLDVGAGDEGVLFSRDEHRSADRDVRLETIEQRGELVAHTARDDVHRRARGVEGDHRDAVGDRDAERCHARAPGEPGVAR